MDWVLKINFHWPHHRFLCGWEVFYSDEIYDYNTIRLFLFIVTLELDF